MALAPNASFNTQRRRLPVDYGMAPVGRNPQDAKFLQTTRRNAETPTDVLSAIHHLATFLSPPTQVTMGGQTRPTGVGMIPIVPEGVAARFGASWMSPKFPNEAAQQITDIMGGRTGGQVFPLLQRTGPKSTDSQKALLQWYMSQAKRPHP